MPSETSPLLVHQPTAAEAAYAAAAESAIASAFANPEANASAFNIPVQPEEDEDEEEAIPEGVLVTETPMRTDLFIVLGGMWVGVSWNVWGFTIES